MKGWYTVTVHNVAGRSWPVVYEHFGTIASARDFACLLLDRHDGSRRYVTVDNEQGNQVVCLNVS